jgi:biopolymer transport protein ExbD
MGDINVVSLIDVMMLLLVIFMITAPIMQGGVDLTLPSAEAQPLEAKGGMVVSVTMTGVYIDEQPMSDGEFRAGFKALAAKRAKDGVYLRVDKAVTAQRFMNIFTIMKNAGVKDIGIVTEPADIAK